MGWTISGSSVADHPLRPAEDHRLGEPLPQLANPQAYLDAGPRRSPSLARRHYAAVLAIIFNGYPPHQKTFLGIVTAPSAARRPLTHPKDFI